MAGGFSAGVRLTDLNDFITPSQTCTVTNPSSKGFSQTKASLAPGEKVKVSLHDCLACSGCVTTAESVMLEQQSVGELMQQLSAARAGGRKVVVSVSPQSRAALAAHYGITPLQALQKLTTFLKSLGVWAVVDTSVSRDVSLVEVCHEFLDRYRASCLPQAQMPLPAAGAADQAQASSRAPNGAADQAQASSRAPNGAALLEAQAGAMREPSAHRAGFFARALYGRSSSSNDLGSLACCSQPEWAGAAQPSRPKECLSDPSLFSTNDSLMHSSTHVQQHQSGIQPMPGGHHHGHPQQQDERQVAQQPQEVKHQLPPLFAPLSNGSSSASPWPMPPPTSTSPLGTVAKAGSHGHLPDAAQPSLPVLSSACPGWVCYAEKRHGEEVLAHMSRVKSAQQIMGTLLKRTPLGQSLLGLRPEDMYHVTVMPCYDKKLEALRDDFQFEVDVNADSANGTGMDATAAVKEVDCVLTSGELFSLLQEHCADFMALPEDPLHPILVDIDQEGRLLGVPGGSGSFAETVVRYVAKEVYGVVLPLGPLLWRQLRNADMREYSLVVGGAEVLRVACAYGFHNVQNIVRKAKAGKLDYHFVEVMACPGGCLSGGGQPKPRPGRSLKSHLLDLEERYLKEVHIHDPFTGALVRQLYSLDHTGAPLAGAPPLDAAARARLLHTTFHAHVALASGAAAVSLSPASLSNW